VHDGSVQPAGPLGPTAGASRFASAGSPFPLRDGGGGGGGASGGLSHAPIADQDAVEGGCSWSPAAGAGGAGPSGGEAETAAGGAPVGGDLAAIIDANCCIGSDTDDDEEAGDDDKDSGHGVGSTAGLTPGSVAGLGRREPGGSFRGMSATPLRLLMGGWSAEGDDLCHRRRTSRQHNKNAFFCISLLGAQLWRNAQRTHPHT